jgi:2-polyprenyl-6-hydroxyphenyl methylase/3-demethylubiquinone-9 3-methyltransferase
MCGFIFTNEFDELSDEELGAAIYNADYIKADPEFEFDRPKYLSEIVADIVRKNDAPKCLDFGAGSGLFAAMMRERGFAFDAFDPYFLSSHPSNSLYDFVTCFEVMEHSRRPLETLLQIAGYLAEGAMILFSTHIAPPGVDLSWWYIAPRNGHFSIYSKRALWILGRRCGLQYVQISSATHLFCSPRGSPIATRIVKRLASEMLYNASRLGMQSYCKQVCFLASYGAISAVLSRPKSPGRAIIESVRSLMR